MMHKQVPVFTCILRGRLSEGQRGGEQEGGRKKSFPSFSLNLYFCIMSLTLNTIAASDLSISTILAFTEQYLSLLVGPLTASAYLAPI